MARKMTSLPVGKWFQESGSMLTLKPSADAYVFFTMATDESGYGVDDLNADNTTPSDLGISEVVQELAGGLVNLPMGDIPEGALLYVTDSATGAAPGDDLEVKGAFCNR